ncbi:MAG: VOC family protein [Lachnospiraceae bacterium]|nr:VOC family protein [Lachnospiraceae bacterium]
MTYEELESMQKKRHICQIGFLTTDLKRSMDMWIEKLHVGPWRVVTMNNQSVTENAFLVDGELVDAPYQFVLAISYIGDMQVELIQPQFGPTIYQKFIDEHGEGIHHFKIVVPPEEWEENLAAYAERGMELTMTGKFGLSKYAYINSEKFVDFQVEFGDNIPNPSWPEGSNVYYYPPKEE